MQYIRMPYKASGWNCEASDGGTLPRHFIPSFLIVCTVSILLRITRKAATAKTCPRVDA